MRARLFDADDDEAMELLESVLEELDTELGDPEHLLGVDVYQVPLEDRTLTFYSSQWSMEVEGPKSLVEMVLGHFRQPLE